MIKYDRIVSCNYKNRMDLGTIYLLVSSNNVSGRYAGGLDVDLNSECWFNETFEPINEKIELEVNNIEQVYQFCNIHNIKLNSDRIIENEGLLCGGESDLLIDCNLNAKWIEL